MTDTGSTLPRRQLGRYLREARTAVNMSLERMACLTDLSSSGLQRLETGQATRLKVRDLQAICEVLDLSEEMSAAMVGLLRQSAEPNWWHEYGNLIPTTFDVYVGLETAARKLTTYQPSLVLGLLQTAEYAAALIQAGTPAESSDELRRRVELRMKRQTIVTRKRRPIELEVVLHECALRSAVGGDRVMAPQLHHLAEIGKMPNVTIRVLPFAAGAPIGHPVGQYAILEFGDDSNDRAVEPPVVYLENFTGCLYLEKADDIQRYAWVHDCLRRASLDEAASRSLLRQVAKELQA
ncbi:helix-turn-helix domain-containing protein [Nocardia abscessus]|uniref:helix-turn-helix domain-containing protein n=1 Tax=Nocardia abscessus TaxID=120957 RepID=UPI002454BAAD|nr:helix-turn-helix transcriptional regulator [Nocardia abscessus]